MSEMTLEEATGKLSEVVQEFEAKLSEAQAIADKYGLSFHIEPAYGMGGYYQGKGEGEWESSWDDSYSEDGWMASSQSC